MLFRKRFLCLLLGLACLLSLSAGALAAQVDCDAVYCFTTQDFSEADEALTGICITHLPDAGTGTVMLGSRVLQPGDILTAEQVAQMTFSPLRTLTDTQAEVCYLPIFENRVAPAATMAISIRGKEDKAPVAQDSAIETYKNLPNEGLLQVKDPEGQTLTYSLLRQPKRGEVVLREDGSFLYTPKKNKVGVDSFTFTAADPAGNVSREATVTIQILKPSDSRQYADTVGLDCRFEAEWLRNTGLFVGESVSGQACFDPDKTVDRGQFLAMLVQTLDIPLEDASYASMQSDTPDWLKPYLAAALRSGLMAGLPDTQTGSFRADEPITGAEAAVMLQNALDLTVSLEVLEAVRDDQQSQTQVPVWAASSLCVMADHGVQLQADAVMTRADTAKVLYQVSRLAVTAPGTSVFRA